MTNIIITLVLLVIAAISKAVMDTLQYHYEASIFKSKKLKEMFWNPVISWKNKYVCDGYNWKAYCRANNNYPVFKGKYLKPKFFGSITFLVFLTDGWHLFQMLFLSSVFALILFYDVIVVFDNNVLNYALNYIILRVVFGGVFELFYRNLLLKK